MTLAGLKEVRPAHQPHYPDGSSPTGSSDSRMLGFWKWAPTRITVARGAHQAASMWDFLRSSV